ncbi:MAG TPA: CoA ester lyase [Candidatus Thermoplasmatota archaeon]|nr:CoA ester lyase [Candidatus Thermoplasmatota archaeon]
MAKRAAAPGAPRPFRCRSLLYTPADRPERYVKAWTEGLADIVAADLEDAVAPAGKAAARKAVVKALAASPKANALRAVRVNPLGTPACEADLAVLLPAGPDLLVVPKVEDAAALRRLADRVEAESAGAIRLVAILETARGVVYARELLNGAPLAAACFGAEDLAADVGIRKGPTNHEVLAARQWVVLCAAAAGIPALDMITADYKDLDLTRREAAEARAFGFQGKMCIHPAQVPVVHRAFRPSKGELAWARKVLAAARKAKAGKGGVTVVDGRMVDVPVIRQAERVVSDMD